MSAAHTARQFENAWLSRYPRPTRCAYGQGTCFKAEFLQCLNDNGIKRAPTTVKSPQANATCERMHQSIGNTLRALHTLHPPEGLTELRQLVDQALSNAMYATMRLCAVLVL